MWVCCKLLEEFESARVSAQIGDEGTGPWVSDRGEFWTWPVKILVFASPTGCWSETTLNYWIMMEIYPDLKEVACRLSVSKRKRKRGSTGYKLTSSGFSLLN